MQKIGRLASRSVRLPEVLTGVTTDEWLEAYRWVAIRDVLLHTDWPLGEVATKMGYSSVKTFSTPSSSVSACLRPIGGRNIKGMISFSGKYKYLCACFTYCLTYK